jgi:4-hydroxybenzoate polyprenyltransferase
MKFNYLIKISRPIIWFLPLICFSFGVSLSHAILSPLLLIEFLMLSFPFNFFLYGINDIFDYESDILNPRKGSIEGVKLEPKRHDAVKKVSIAMAILLLLISLATFNIANILSMVFLIFISYAYSAPPFRIKEKPPFDSISNIFIYFLMPLILGFSFGGSIISIPWQVYLLSLSIVGAHAFTTLADYTPDKKAGEKTFSIIFGKKTTVIFASLCQFIPAIVIAITINSLNGIIVISFLLFSSFLFLIGLFSLSEKHTLIIAKVVIVAFIVAAVLFLLNSTPLLRLA